MDLSFFTRNQLVPLATILGGALIVAASIGAWSAFAIKSSSNTLSVTGSAKTAVKADSVRFTFNISRTVTQDGLAGGYQQLDSDLKIARAYLTEAKVPDTEITVEPAMANQIYDNNNSGPTRYNVTRTIKINSVRVEEIAALAQSLATLAGRGVLVQANAPEYYYTKLSELRVSLLGDALKDAKARAAAIAKESGQHVGKLQSASSGVVQVLAPNSIDVSDYGQYDTTSVDKEVMVTTRATFSIW